jgi:lysozyme
LSFDQESNQTIITDQPSRNGDFTTAESKNVKEESRITPDTEAKGTETTALSTIVETGSNFQTSAESDAKSDTTTAINQESLPPSSSPLSPSNAETISEPIASTRDQNAATSAVAVTTTQNSNGQGLASNPISSLSSSLESSTQASTSAITSTTTTSTTTTTTTTTVQCLYSKILTYSLSSEKN